MAIVINCTVVFWVLLVTDETFPGALVYPRTVLVQMLVIRLSKDV